MRVTAPGKLVLIGEYAVLDGAPALSLAVAHGVSCDVEPSQHRTLRTPDGDDRFVRAALDDLGVTSGTFDFRAAQPFDLPGKPGMGGSAAAVVAALVAGGNPRDLLARALRVHHEVQGSGSGIDVATAVLGSICFEQHVATSVELPVPLAVYVGRSAKTGPRVARYRQWADRRSFVADSRGWVDAFPSDPIHVTRAAYRGLTAMSRAASVEYLTPEIEAVVDVAEAMGGAAKPSGAGGGDTVIAWVEDPAAFYEAIRALGLHPLELSPGEAARRE